MKEFFTYEQQIEKLRQNGLDIKDEQEAIRFLKSEGYYNIINGYSPNFKTEKGDFRKGTSFEDIHNLYVFDKDLRSIMYKYTSSIETHVKALIAHEFSRVHGVGQNNYLKPECFSSSAKCADAIERLINECNTTITEALNRNSNKYREYIAHNFNSHNHVPMWVLIRALSFGTTSIFYKNMITAEREIIAKNYNVSAAQLANMLEVVVSYRNIVAHGERTFCARLPKTRLSTQLSVTRKLCIAKNAKGENKFGRNDFLALLICCKYLLPSEEFNGLIAELTVLINGLTVNFNPSMVARIKTSMGIKSNSWTVLPKLTIDDMSD